MTRSSDVTFLNFWLDQPQKQWTDNTELEGDKWSLGQPKIASEPPIQKFYETSGKRKLRY